LSKSRITEHTFLGAVNGKVDTGDGSGTVNELKAHPETQVPEVTKKVAVVKQ
jgi:hypothetical protein